jgi:hypothetical protein
MAATRNNNNNNSTTKHKKKKKELLLCEATKQNKNKVRVVYMRTPTVGGRGGMGRGSKAPHTHPPTTE